VMRTAGFSVDQVEQAMMATVCNGGDLHDALDWLCLNLPNGKYRVVLSSATASNSATTSDADCRHSPTLVSSSSHSRG